MAGDLIALSRGSAAAVAAALLAFTAPAAAGPLELVLSPVAATGDPAQGTGGNFAAIGGYSIGGAGEIAFLAISDGPGHFVTDGFSGVWSAPRGGGPTAALLRTDDAPGLFSAQGDQLQFSKNFGQPFVGADGAIAVSDQGRLGALFLPQNGAWAAPADGLPAPLGLSTQFAGPPFDANPGEPQVRLTSFQDAGATALLVSNGPAGAPTQGVFRAGSGAPEAVAVTGGAAPEAGGAVFAGFEAPVLNRGGDAAFLAKLGGDGVTAANDAAVFKERDGQLELVARKGDAAPGTNSVFSNFAPGGNGLPTINETGETAFVGEFKETLVFNDREFVFTRDGIWRGAGAGDLQLVARELQATPTSIGPVQFNAFAEPLLAGEKRNEFGEVVPSDLVFRATDNTGLGIWRQSEGLLSPIAQRFQEAPGADGDQFFVLFAPTINSAGDVAFYAQLTGPGVTFQNDLALFAQSADGGALTMIAREGEVVDERFGAIAELVATPFLSGTQEGGPAFLADNGDVAFAARYAGGATALYRAAFENPATVNFVWNGGCGDGDWHTTCGEETNWLDADRGTPAADPPGDDPPLGETARIESAQVTLRERAATLRSLEVTGEGAGLLVQAPLTLAEESRIEGLVLGSDLSVGERLTLAETSELRRGTVSASTGDGVLVARDLILKTGSDAVAVEAPTVFLNAEVEVQEGALALRGGAFHDANGRLTVRDGAELVLGGEHTFGGRLDVAGTGRVALDETSILQPELSRTVQFSMSGADGGLFIEGGRLGGVGDVVIVGKAVWSGGALTGMRQEAGGTLAGGILNSGLDFDIVGDGAKTLEGMLRNQGTVRQDADVAFDGGVLANEGRYELAAGAILAQPSGRIVNEGVFARVAGADGAGDGVVEVAFDNKDGGLIDVQAGKLTLQRGEHSGGSYRAAAGATLQFSDGSTVVTGDVAATGAGTVRLATGEGVGGYSVAEGALASFALGDVEARTGGLVLDGAVVALAGDLENAGYAIWRGGQVATSGGAALFNAGLLALEPQDEGALQLSGDLNNFAGRVEHGRDARLELAENARILNFETYRLQGTIAAAGPGTLFLNDGDLIADNPGGVVRLEARLDNRGTPARDGSVLVKAGTEAVFAGPVEQLSFFSGFIRLTDGRWEVEDGASLTLAIGEGAIANPQINVIQTADVILRGTGRLNNLPLRDNGEFTILRDGDDFGTVELRDAATWDGGPIRQHGLLLIDGTSSMILDVPANPIAPESFIAFRAFAGSRTVIDGSLTVFPDPLVPDVKQRTIFDAGSELSGSGIINGGLVMEGTFSPGSSPGLFTVNGDFAQGAEGRLVIEIAGLLPGAEYDVLDVTGNVTLDGLLELVFLDGFAPEIDDVFEFLLVGGELFGGFDEVRVFGLGTATFDLAFDPRAGALRLSNVQASVPEPGALGLMGLGLAGLALRRRRLAA